MTDLPIIAHFIDGALAGGEGEPRVPLHDPATGRAIAHVALASQARVAQAVASAAKAFHAWAATPPHVRVRPLFRLRELLERDAGRLAGMITREHGKLVSDARGEITRGLEVVEFACGIPQLLKGEFSESVGRGISAASFRQPLGVVAGITPFNFPAMVPMWMFPVALACGNTFVLKPSEKNPGLSIELALLLKEAGLPDGVFNVVQGDKTAVDALLDDARVAAISFVGSTPVARHVHQRASAAGKRVQALGGAKNHMVVMPDADLDQALDGLMGAAYGSAGERCMAISVAVPVGRETGDRLVARLADRVRALRIGPGTDEAHDMGPLITAEHRDRVRAHIDQGEAEGALLVVDGREYRHKDNQGGFFLGASLFDHVTAEMRIYREEIFGPVLSVVRAADFEQALGIVNGHEFANGAAIYTRDGQTAQQFLQRVEAGMVGINVPIPVPMAFHSFGGWKGSLFGDHHMHGAEGVRFYTRYKTSTVRWPEGPSTGADFIMPTQS